MVSGRNEEAEMTGLLHSEMAKSRVEDRLREAPIGRRPGSGRKYGRTLVVMALAAAGIAAFHPGDVSANTATLTYTDPGEHELRVPDGVTSIRVHAAGAKGQNGYGPVATGGA